MGAGLLSARYYRSPDGTTQIILPAGLAVFSTVVDGGSMEEEDETYTLDIKIVDNDEVLFEETSDYPISLFSEHSIPIQLTDESISIGELSVQNNTLNHRHRIPHHHRCHHHPSQKVQEVFPALVLKRS